MQIVNLSPKTILTLSEAASRADAEDRDLRLAFGTEGGLTWVKFKVGGGMWSPPFYGMYDPDLSVSIPPTRVGDYVMTVE